MYEKFICYLNSVNLIYLFYKIIITKIGCPKILFSEHPFESNIMFILTLILNNLYDLCILLNCA